MVGKTILNDTPVKLLKKYREVLLANGIPVEKMILFGSYAKGSQKPWSDLDVCVVSKIFGKNFYDDMLKLAKLTINIENMIEPHPYNPTDLKDPYDPLAYEIMKTGKVVA